MSDLGGFWSWFESIAPQLGLRQPSYRKIFTHLSEIARLKPIIIVETGCMRTPGNWSGDGQSSILFDKFLEYAPHGGRGFAIDIDPAATRVCAENVSDRITVLTGDSVSTLRRIAKELQAGCETIDLLYLDSYDVNWEDVTPSAVHHLKELVSIAAALRPDSLVMVDDSPSNCFCVPGDAGQLSVLMPPKINGKGKYVAEYAQQIGAELLFTHYQSAWKNFV